MGLRFIRQPSETPNVSNADDARMIRYAYGGYNGYVKGKGTELGYTIDGSIFKVTSGVVVLQGWETEIDANGWSLTVDSVATKRYFIVYYEVNLATQTVKIDSTYSTSSYPEVPAGDDLTSVSTGTARMVLYKFEALSGVISNVVKVVSAIEYTVNIITAEIAARNNAINTLTNGTTSQVMLGDGSKRSIATSIANNNDIPTNAAVYNSINGDKGTLSFTKLTSATGFALNIGQLTIITAIGVLQNGSYGDVILTIPVGFRPASKRTGFIIRTDDAVYCDINTDGTVTFFYNNSAVGYASLIFMY